MFKMGFNGVPVEHDDMFVTLLAGLIIVIHHKMSCTSLQIQWIAIRRPSSSRVGLTIDILN